MNKISKPDLVDLLRIADHSNWFFPRIRYASIRSKPALIQDLRLHFADRQKGDFLEFGNRRQNDRLPHIVYDLTYRRFLFDGKPVDAPKLSREKPVFSIRREKVTVSF